jgi:dihydroorotate dehydrogenase
MKLYKAIRPVLFSLPPESAHRLAVRVLQLRGVLPTSHVPSIPVEVAGLSFPNPIGLAAGFDKNAECYTGALKAGFGFVEVGTLTPKAQPGNPQPRMFRLPEHGAVINRLGFNNEGVEAAVRRLKTRDPQAGIVGGNIGKNKRSEDALADYGMALEAVYPYVDYITANISSPNTPGLRDMQQGDTLLGLVKHLHQKRAELMALGQPRKPVFIKIAPDNHGEALDTIAEVALDTTLDGLIISNTTIGRDEVAGHRHAAEAGGLSGAPLMALSTEVLQHIYQRTQGKIPLIGVGGIRTADDVKAKLDAGASLVQLYTGLIYEGLGAVKHALKELAADI